jgi:hypothetical protein
METLSDNINNYINSLTNRQVTTQIQHIYEIDTPDILKNIVKGNVDNELGDGDHDLVRKGEETNPLIMYCDKNKSGQSYINGTFFNVSFTYKGMNRSQIKIVEEMEKNIKLNQVTHKNRTITEFERTTVNIEKYMINLQEYLSNPQPKINTTGPISNTIVETHRGQEWDNNRVPLAKMYKAKLTTTFDNPGKPDMDIGEIYDMVKPERKNINYNENGLPLLPLLRFYPNYLPNAFSVFMKPDDFRSKLNYILHTYYSKNDIFSGIDINIERDRIMILFSNLPQDKKMDLLLLHMFSNENTTSYSIQYGQITANEVTHQLYGYPKRGCPENVVLDHPNMVFEDAINPFMKNCHILWGKTCGDGVSIEAANMLSYLTDQPVNVLSYDECCNLRATFITGLSTCQKQSTFAGTGLGFLSTHRNVKFFKSTNIGRRVEEIYKEKILEITNPDEYYGQQLQLLNNNNKLISHIQDITIIDEFVNKFIQKKNAVLDQIFNKFKFFIDNKGLNQDNRFDHKTFYELGKFNIQNYVAEIDEYRSSFTKLLNDFNTRFENIFMYNPRNPLGDEDIKDNIELGVRFMSSIEEKLIECGMSGTENLDDQRKQIVFTFLSTLMTSIGDQKVKRYCVLLYNNILELFRSFIHDYNIFIEDDVKNNYLNDVVINESDYDYLCKTLYDNIAGIGPEETEKYKNKCIIKENINLLKFILRHQEFMTNPDSPYKLNQKLINSKMNTKTQYSVLEDKVDNYKGFYESTRNKFPSPIKTAEKRIKDKKRSDESNTNSSTETSPDKSNEKTRGTSKKVRITSISNKDIIGDNDINRILTPEELSEDNRPSGFAIGFNEEIFDEDNFNNVFRGVEDCDDIENKLSSAEGCNNINNCDDPDNLFLGVTNFISNISTLCYTALSNIFSSLTTTDTEIERFEQEVKGIQEAMKINIIKQNQLIGGMTLRSGTTVELPNYQTEMDSLEQEMAKLKSRAEDIEREINKIIGNQQEQQIATSSSSSNVIRTPPQTPGGSSYFPFSFSFFPGKKGGKKSPKKPAFTRRKNNKTSKRKTMKKRKIPKRKNKTRRLRQRK